jgi:hypothetical protein
MATTATARTTAQPLDPGFPKGRFQHARAKDADWQVGLRPHFAYRDLGIAPATEGKGLAHPGDEHTHSLDFQMVRLVHETRGNPCPRQAAGRPAEQQGR